MCISEKSTKYNKEIKIKTQYIHYDYKDRRKQEKLVTTSQEILPPWLSKQGGLNHPRGNTVTLR